MLTALIFGLTVKQLILYAIVIAAALAVAWVVIVKVFKWTIPEWFLNIVLIVVACVVAVLAVIFLFSLIQGQ